MSFINYNTKNKGNHFPGVYKVQWNIRQSTFGCVSLEAGVMCSDTQPSA